MLISSTAVSAFSAPTAADLFAQSGFNQSPTGAIGLTLIFNRRLYRSSRRRNYFDGPAKYIEGRRRDDRRTRPRADAHGSRHVHRRSAAGADWSAGRRKIDARPVAKLNPDRRPQSFLSARIEPAKWYLFCDASAGRAPPFNLISEAPFPSIIDTGVTAARTAGRGDRGADELRKVRSL